MEAIVGGGMGAGMPRRRLTNACWCDVNSRRASRSVSAAVTLRPSITYGRLQLIGWPEAGAIDFDGAHQWAGAKCDANA